MGRLTRAYRELSGPHAVVGVLILASVSLSGCVFGGGGASRSEAGSGTKTVAGVELHPVSRPVVTACRLAAKDAPVPILCPTRLPRQVRDAAGSRAVPAGPLAPFGITSTKSAGSTIGISFGYSGEIDDPRKNRPDRFLHFEVQAQDQRLPPRVREVNLGGRSGLLAKATPLNYRDETYWANHVRFFWTEDGARYAASLHDFGPDTVRVLDALVAGLAEPATLRAEARQRRSSDVTTIPIPIHGPMSVLIAGGRVWVAGQGDTGSFAEEGESHRPSLVRIDPGSRKVVTEPVQIHFGAGPVAITQGNSTIWVAHRAAESKPLRLLDPGSGRFIGRVAGPPNTVAVAFGHGTAWVVDLAGVVRRSAPDADRFSATIRVGRAPAGIAVDDLGVWVTNSGDDTVSRIDPRTNKVVATIRAGDSPTGIAAGGGAVWVANGGDGTVSRIDPRANRVTRTIRVGRGPRGVAAARKSVWVTNELDDSVSRIDSATNDVRQTIPVGAGPVGVVVGEGAVWVTNNQDQTVSRIKR